MSKEREYYKVFCKAYKPEPNRLGRCSSGYYFYIPEADGPPWYRHGDILVGPYSNRRSAELDILSMKNRQNVS